MCKIILFLFLFPSLCFGYSTLSLSYQGDNKGELIELDGTPRGIDSYESSATIAGEFYSVLPKLDLTASLTQSSLNPSKIYIQNQAGNTVALNDSSEEEMAYSATVSASYAWEDYTFDLSQTVPIEQEYFKSTSTTAGVSRAFYNRSTVIGAEATKTTSEKPLSYFNDISTLQRKSSPTQTDTNSYKLKLSQYFNIHTKGLFALGYQEKTNLRPRNYSGAAKLGYALSDQWFTKFGYTYTFEDRGDQLIDSVGYLDNHAASFEVSYELTYDLLLSASYDAILEFAEDPRNDSKNRVGVDQFGLAAKYDLAKYSIEVKSSYIKSNTDTDIVNFYGALKWTL